MQNKSQILSILLGVASIFSPFIYNFGNLLQAGAMAKMQRIDELQGLDEAVGYALGSLDHFEQLLAVYRAAADGDDAAAIEGGVHRTSFAVRTVAAR